MELSGRVFIIKIISGEAIDTMEETLRKDKKQKQAIILIRLRAELSNLQILGCFWLAKTT